MTAVKRVRRALTAPSVPSTFAAMGTSIHSFSAITLGYTGFRNKDNSYYANSLKEAIKQSARHSEFIALYNNTIA